MSFQIVAFFSSFAISPNNSVRHYFWGGDVGEMLFFHRHFVKTNGALHTALGNVPICHTERHVVPLAVRRQLWADVTFWLQPQPRSCPLSLFPLPCWCACGAAHMNPSFPIAGKISRSIINQRNTQAALRHFTGTSVESSSPLAQPRAGRDTRQHVAGDTRRAKHGFPLTAPRAQCGTFDFL